MKHVKRLILTTVCGAVLLSLGAGCNSGGETTETTASPAATGGNPAPATSRDPKVQSDPNIPPHIREQMGGKRSGPSQ